MDSKTIYSEELNSALESLKRSKKELLDYQKQHKYHKDIYYFEFADDDFYLHQALISQIEGITKSKLLNILYRMFEMYSIDIEKISNSPQYTTIQVGKIESIVNFVMQTNGIRVGVRLDDDSFWNITDIKQEAVREKLDLIYIITLYQNGEQNQKQIAYQNVYFKENGIPVEWHNLNEIYSLWFSHEEYSRLDKALNAYFKEAREVIAYATVGVLSSINYSDSVENAEKKLLDLDYTKMHYAINDPNSFFGQIYIGKKIDIHIFDSSDMQVMLHNYIGEKRYRSMVGDSAYAVSFITAEWLYNSFKEKENFDYTSVIVGYAKSIEQLLWAIVVAKMGQPGLLIASNKREKELNEKNVSFKKKQEGKKNYNVIDLTQSNKNMIQDSMWGLTNFLRINRIMDVNYSRNVIIDMIDCFRCETRNEYLHKNNLDKWEIAEKIRNNAMFLYFLILGSVHFEKDEIKNINIKSIDWFDILCSQIRDLSGYSIDFELIYNDKTIFAIYDFRKNMLSFDNKGKVSNKDMWFIRVPDFSEQTYNKLDSGDIDKRWEFAINRTNYPSIIRTYDLNKKVHEIDVEQLVGAFI